MPGMIIMDLQQNKLYQREQKCQRNEYIITDRKKRNLTKLNYIVSVI